MGGSRHHSSGTGQMYPAIVLILVYSLIISTHQVIIFTDPCDGSHISAIQWDNIFYTSVSDIKLQKTLVAGQPEAARIQNVQSIEVDMRLGIIQDLLRLHDPFFSNEFFETTVGQYIIYTVISLVNTCQGFIKNCGYKRDTSFGACLHITYKIADLSLVPDISGPVFE